MSNKNRGFEISSNTVIKSFDEIKTAGYGFIVIRCLTPKGEIDPKFIEYTTKAKEVDLPVWVSFTVSNYKNICSLIESIYNILSYEAPIAFNCVKKILIKLPNDTVKSMSVEDKLTFFEYVNEYYRSSLPIDRVVCCGYNSFNKLPKEITEDNRNRFVISRYPFGNNDDGTVQISLKPDYKNLKYWLYTNKGCVPGVKNFVSLIKSYPTKHLSLSNDNQHVCMVRTKEKLRNKPSVIFSKTIDTIQAGTICTYDGSSRINGWILIKIGDTSGYVKESRLDFLGK